MESVPGRKATVGRGQKTERKKRANWVAMQRVVQIMLLPSLVTLEENGEGDKRNREEFRRGPDGKPVSFSFRQPPTYAYVMALEVMIFVFNFFLPRDPKAAQKQAELFRVALDRLTFRVVEDDAGKAVLRAQVEGIEGEGYMGEVHPLDGQKYIAVASDPEPEPEAPKEEGADAVVSPETE